MSTVMARVLTALAVILLASGGPALAASADQVGTAIPARHHVAGPGRSLPGRGLGAASLVGTTTVLGWGQDAYGQLANGSSPASETVPVTASLPAGTEVTGIAAGYDHSLIVTSAGGVLAAGRNDVGQLGDGTTTDTDVPVTVALPSYAAVKQAAAGDDFSLAVTDAGGVFAWGADDQGQLGNGQTTGSPVESPVPVYLPESSVTQVAAGADWGAALTTAGQVFTWGGNLFGQLGNGTTTGSDAAVDLALPAGVTVTQIAAGAYTGYALTSTGTVYAWGSGAGGTLGNGSTASSDTPVQVSLPAGTTVTQIASAGGFALARTSAGQVLAWGGGGSGQLGDGSTANSDVPVPVSLPAGTTVTDIAAGGAFGLAVTSTAQVLAWGDNSYGELGDGSTSNSDVPVAVALPAGTKIGTVAAGQDHALALPVPAPQVTAITPADGLPGGGGTITITGGGFTSATQVRFGKIAARSVKVVSDSTITAVIPAGTGRVDVTVTTPLGGTSLHSAADQYTYLAKGSVLEWGYNFYGQLGNGQTFGQSLPVAAHLPAGTVATATARTSETSYALTSSGTVYAWGSGALGQLGNGGMTDSLQPVKVDFPAGTVIKAISAGLYTGYALTASGEVYAWGNNGDDELGDGESSSADADMPVLVSLPPGANVTEIAAEQYGGLALTSAGTVLAWGYNVDGELGNGAYGESDVPVTVQLPAGTKALSIAGSALGGYARTSAGTVLGWGYNAYGNLGNGTDDSSNVPVPVSLPDGIKVTALAAAYYTVYALTSAGKVLAWGNGHEGELGNGTTSSSEVPVAVSLPSGTTVTAVSGEAYSGLARTTTGKLLIWGYGDYGDLGDGTSSSTDVPTTVKVPGGISTTRIGPSMDDGGAIVVSPVTVVTRLTPSRGVAGVKITITGLNLAGATKVRFGTRAATFTVISPTKIIATVPAGTGTVAVTVTAHFGTSARTTSDRFTYRA